jgi:hypothetical protein
LPIGTAATNFDNLSIVGIGADRFGMSEIENIRTLAHESAHHIDYCRAASKNTTSSAIPVQQYPFKGVIECLLSDAGGGFKESDFKLNEFRSAEGVCFNNFHNEAFCDWMAAKAVASYLKKNPAPKEATVNMAFTKSNPDSKIIKFPERLRTSFYVIDQICAERTTGRAGDSDHPSRENRFLKIYAREPEVAKSLGCGPSTTQACSNSSTANTSKPSTTQSTTK